MTDERFNQLLNGPLNHPIPMFTITRLVRALMFVVERVGEEGELALEEFCAQQQQDDESQD